MIFINVILTMLVCIAISYLIWSYHRPWFSGTTNTLPGPRLLPFIGNAHYLLQQNPDEMLNIFTKWAEDYSSPFRCWMGNKLFIFVNKPDQIKKILQNSHCLNKSIVYKLFEKLLGEGILTVPVTLMNVKLKPSTINQFLETMERLKTIATYVMQHLFLYSDFIFNLTSIGRECKKNINYIHDFIDNIMQQQIDTSNEFNTKNKSGRNRTFLDVLMQSSYKKEFMQDDFMKMLRDNILIMLLEASETTATTLNFAVFVLANFSEIQEKVYKELWEIYGTKNPKSTPIKYKDLQHMKYLENVIKETMRLFPIVPLIARKLTEDLNIGETILSKGADVVLQIMTAHRNEKYWPNPLVFDPDRFLPENIGTSNLSYMPFSLGSRNCIGIKYAMISMKVFLATLVRTFKLKVDKNIQIDEIKLYFDFTLRTAEPIKIRFEKRDVH